MVKINKNMGDHIEELKGFLDRNQDNLRKSIINLIEYKKKLYNSKLYNSSTGKGIVKDFEAAQDKYIATLCSFGLTKDEIIYILPNDPSTLHVAILDNMNPDREMELAVAEYDLGHFIRTLDEANVKFEVLEAVLKLLGIDPNPYITSETKGKKTVQKINWPGNKTQKRWNDLSRDNKMDFVDTVWLVEDSINPLSTFKTRFRNELLNLQRYYMVIKHAKSQVIDQLQQHQDILQDSGKWNKLVALTSRETQCSKAPQFFGKQAGGIVWEYLQKESSEYFSLLTEYQTVVDIIKRIDVIEKQIKNDTSWSNHYTKLVKLIDAFDRAVTGDARDDIKEWLKNEVMSFVRLWQLFKTKHLNFTLEGPPGSGKTTVAQTIGPIFSQLGILVLGKWRIVSRSDLVGQYVGETAAKMKGILNSMLESVLFIDEAYSVACNEPITDQTDISQLKYDQYGIEAINEIVNFLDKNAGNIMVIAAGYVKDMKYCFFNANSGLERRFPTRHFLKNMSGIDLFNIFAGSVRKILSKQQNNEVFTGDGLSCASNLIMNTPNYWVNQAGDMKNLAAVVASAYATKNGKLTGDDINTIVRDIFQHKDLDRMAAVPERFKKEQLENYTEEQVNDVLRNTVTGDDLDVLMSMINTGKQLRDIDVKSLDWMHPVNGYKLSRFLKEQKEKETNRLREIFTDTLSDYCKTNKSDNDTAIFFNPTTPISNQNNLNETLGDDVLNETSNVFMQRPIEEPNGIEEPMDIEEEPIEELPPADTAEDTLAAALDKLDRMDYYQLVELRNQYGIPAKVKKAKSIIRQLIKKGFK